MRRTVIAFLLLAAAATLAQGGAFTLAPVPSPGPLMGLPGTTVGWGFEVTYQADSNPDVWMALTGSDYFGGIAFGAYADLLAANFYVFGPTPGSVPVAWDGLGGGLGEFQIYPSTPVGLIPGTISVYYALFSEDPNVNPDSFLGEATFGPLQANVVATPEPGSALLLGAAALPIALAIRRRRARRA